MRTAVVIATVDRREHLARLINALDNQSRRPDAVIISAPTPENVAGIPVGDWLHTVTGARGAAAQRNLALDSLPADTDIIVFLDDDALPRGDFIEAAIDVFRSSPDIAGLTGLLTLDGAQRKVPVTFEEADAFIASSWGNTDAGMTAVSSLYGCNFAVRAKVARDLRFDDALPLYSWLEDLDYSRRLSRRGRLVRASQCVAVHHGSASGGRQQHLRFGYSQITNPIHIWRNGSITAIHAATLALKPLLKNVADSIRPSGDARWRRQRLRGNLLSLADVTRGRITPGRITTL